MLSLFRYDRRLKWLLALVMCVWVISVTATLYAALTDCPGASNQTQKICFPTSNCLPAVCYDVDVFYCPPSYDCHAAFPTANLSTGTCTGTYDPADHCFHCDRYVCATVDYYDSID